MLSSDPAEVMVALDLDVDGWEDLASISSSGSGSLHRNQGDGTITTAPWPIGATGLYSDMTKADFNNDGRVDLAVLARAQTPPITVYLNEVNGLTSGPSLSGSCPGSATSANAISAGDVNHDGRADLVIASGGNSPTGCVVVYFGLQGGQFSAGLRLSSYDIPGTLRVADIDNDGRDDIVVLHEGWNRIGVYLQQSDGTMAPEQLFYVSTPSHYYAHALGIGDLTGDGCPDVAIAGDSLTTLRGVGCETVFRSGFEAP